MTLFADLRDTPMNQASALISDQPALHFALRALPYPV
jgi:hypothetical protein